MFHEQRLHAIHVDLSDDGTTWNQPRRIHPGWVSMLLNYLCVDYMQLHRDLSGTEDQGLATSLNEWPHHPTLPQPMYVPWDEKGDGTHAGPIANLNGYSSGS